MANKPPASDSKPVDPLDYSTQIDKLRETEPHKNTNKYIEGLIQEASSKAQKTGYSSGFWNGFVLGVVIAFIIWTILTF
jgi:hypothetical protein